MGARSSRRFGCERNTFLASTQSCRISASKSWTCRPPPMSSRLMTSSSTGPSMAPIEALVIIIFAPPPSFRVFPTPSRRQATPPPTRRFSLAGSCDRALKHRYDFKSRREKRRLFVIEGKKARRSAITVGSRVLKLSSVRLSALRCRTRQTEKTQSRSNISWHLLTAPNKSTTTHKEVSR